MTTINTIEDLIRVLDENPEWMEVVRSRLLTPELLELPKQVRAVRRDDEQAVRRD